MSRPLVVAFATSCLLAACAEQDAAPVYVETEYQVRCLSCQPASPDDRARVVQAIDGENGFMVECRVSSSGGDRQVSFSASYSDPESSSRNHSIEVSRANLDGADPGGSCRVRVSEGANTYEGGCTNGDPTDERPCQVELAIEGDVITGSLICEGIPNQSARTSTRHVVAPGTTDGFVEFEVHGCVGL